MSDTRIPDETEAPLEGEALKIINKARRRAAISMLILLIGFMAVAGVVVYRLSTMAPNPGGAYALESVSVPAGAEVISAQAQDGLVTVTFRLGDAVTIRVVNGADGEILRDIAVVAD
jgi:hypothetical protein